MTALMPRGVRWLEVGAVLALFLVIQVSANETGKVIAIEMRFRIIRFDIEL